MIKEHKERPVEAEINRKPPRGVIVLVAVMIWAVIAWVVWMTYAGRAPSADGVPPSASSPAPPAASP
jgi:hypothetical protein